jgi:hypothetical protein
LIYVFDVYAINDENKLRMLAVQYRTVMATCHVRGHAITAFQLMGHYVAYTISQAASVASTEKNKLDAAVDRLNNTNSVSALAGVDTMLWVSSPIVCRSLHD